MRPPDERQLAETFASVRQALDCLERGMMVKDERGEKHAVSAYVVLAMARKTGRDGYPRGSGFEVRGSGVKDPTGESVVSEPEAVAIRDRMLSFVIDGQKKLQAAVTEMAGVVPPPESTAPDGCRVCKNLRNSDGSPHWEQIDRSERCWWHYKFWLAEGVDAPAELGKAKIIEGRKITTRMVEEALAKVRPRASATR